LACAFKLREDLSPKELEEIEDKYFDLSCPFMERNFLEDDGVWFYSVTRSGDTVVEELKEIIAEIQKEDGFVAFMNSLSESVEKTEAADDEDEDLEVRLSFDDDDEEEEKTSGFESFDEIAQACMRLLEKRGYEPEYLPPSNEGENAAVLCLVNGHPICVAENPEEHLVAIDAMFAFRDDLSDEEQEAIDDKYFDLDCIFQDRLPDDDGLVHYLTEAYEYSEFDLEQLNDVIDQAEEEDGFFAFMKSFAPSDDWYNK
jgi:hypothetical protein